MPRSAQGGVSLRTLRGVGLGYRPRTGRRCPSFGRCHLHLKTPARSAGAGCLRPAVRSARADHRRADRVRRRRVAGAARRGRAREAVRCARAGHGCGADELGRRVGAAPARVGELGSTSPAGRGVVGVTFLTVYRLAELLGAAELAAAGRRPVSTPVVASAVRRALARVPRAVRAGRASSRHRRSARRRAPRARRPRRRPARRARRAAATSRTREVVRLHRATKSLLQREWHDEHDLMRVATDLVGDGSPLVAELGTIIAFLPQRWSTPAARLLRGLAEHADVEIIVGVTGVGGGRRAGDREPAAGRRRDPRAGSPRASSRSPAPRCGTPPTPTTRCARSCAASSTRCARACRSSAWPCCTPPTSRTPGCCTSTSTSPRSRTTARPPGRCPTPCSAAACCGSSRSPTPTSPATTSAGCSRRRRCSTVAADRCRPRGGNVCRATPASCAVSTNGRTGSRRTRRRSRTTSTANVRAPRSTRSPRSSPVSPPTSIPPRCRARGAGWRGSRTGSCTAISAASPARVLAAVRAGRGAPGRGRARPARHPRRDRSCADHRGLPAHVRARARRGARSGRQPRRRCARRTGRHGARRRSRPAVGVRSGRGSVPGGSARRSAARRPRTCRARRRAPPAVRPHRRRRARCSRRWRRPRGRVVCTYPRGDLRRSTEHVPSRFLAPTIAAVGEVRVDPVVRVRGHARRVSRQPPRARGAGRDRPASRGSRRSRRSRAGSSSPTGAPARRSRVSTATSRSCARGCARSARPPPTGSPRRRGCRRGRRARTRTSCRPCCTSSRSSVRRTSCSSRRSSAAASCTRSSTGSWARCRGARMPGDRGATPIARGCARSPRRYARSRRRAGSRVAACCGTATAA